MHMTQNLHNKLAAFPRKTVAFITLQSLFLLLFLQSLYSTCKNQDENKNKENI